jgi:hypothetical protein
MAILIWNTPMSSFGNDMCREKITRMPLSRAALRTFRTRAGRSQRRQDQRPKHVVDFIRGKRVSALHPPIQDKRERRGDVLDKKIRWQLARRFSAALKVFLKVIGNQFRQYFLKMLMNNGSSSGSHLGRAHMPVALNMFEDSMAESNNPFVALSRGWRFRLLNRAKHVMDATNEQLVLVAKMHIKR